MQPSVGQIIVSIQKAFRSNVDPLTSRKRISFGIDGYNLYAREDGLSKVVNVLSYRSQNNSITSQIHGIDAESLISLIKGYSNYEAFEEAGVSKKMLMLKTAIENAYLDYGNFMPK